MAKPTIYRFCAEGCLPFYKLAGTGQRRFRRADLDALLVPGKPDEQAEDGEHDRRDGTTIVWRQARRLASL